MAKQGRFRTGRDGEMTGTRREREEIQGIKRQIHRDAAAYANGYRIPIRVFSNLEAARWVGCKMVWINGRSGIAGFSEFVCGIIFHE